MAIGDKYVEGGNMDTPVRHCLPCEPDETGTALRMTEQERIDQLLKLAYGNVHVEHPAITMELARKIIEERRAAGTLNAFVIH